MVRNMNGSIRALPLETSAITPFDSCSYPRQSQQCILECSNVPGQKASRGSSVGGARSKGPRLLPRCRSRSQEGSTAILQGFREAGIERQHAAVACHRASPYAASVMPV